MKICVTALSNNLESEIDPRFGRAKYFILIDTETLEFDAILNENVTGMGGVGIQSGQFMSDKDIQAVITGNVGPNAYKTLTAGDIDIFTGVSGSVKDAVLKFKNNELTKTSNPTVDSHTGQ